MKKRWFVVPLLVGVLALGIMGGTALAQDRGTSSDSPVGKFASKVAAILGLDETKVQDAFKQAAKETQDEALQTKLGRLVEQGRLTQEQADAYKAWYLARPEGIFQGLQLPGMRGPQVSREMQDEALQTKLNRLVEHGRLTQEQADAYMKWFLSRPEGTFPGPQLPQAVRETQDEALQARLDRMVENGRLTQEQADAYLEWYKSRPEGPLPGLGHHGFGGHGFFRDGMMGGQGGMMGGQGMGFWQQMPPVHAPESSDTTTTSH